MPAPSKEWIDSFEVDPNTMHLNLLVFETVAKYEDHMQKVKEPITLDRIKLTLYPDATNPHETITLTSLRSEPGSRRFMPKAGVIIEVDDDQKTDAKRTYRLNTGMRPFLHETGSTATTPAASRAHTPSSQLAAELLEKLQNATPKRHAISEKLAPRRSIRRVLGKLGLKD